MNTYTLPEITRYMKGLMQFFNSPRTILGGMGKGKKKYRAAGTSGSAKTKAVLKRHRRNKISRLARRVNR